MNLPARTTVLFDLDGTIADTVPLIVASFKRIVLELLGWEPTYEQCKEWIGRSLTETFTGLAPERSEELMVGYLEWNLANHRRFVRPFPGVDGLVTALESSGRTFGVATSKRLESALLSLDCVGLTGRIPLLATEEDADTHKPSPEPLLHALAKVGSGPAEAIYVGDAVVDMLAAQAAGVAAVAVTWGAATKDELAAVGPTAIVHTIDELRTLIGLA